MCERVRAGHGKREVRGDCSHLGPRLKGPEALRRPAAEGREPPIRCDVGAQLEVRDGEGARLRGEAEEEGENNGEI